MLSLLVAGRTRSEICRLLGVSVSTVKTWRRDILWRTRDRLVSDVVARVRRELHLGRGAADP